MDEVTEISDKGCLAQLKEAAAGVIIAPILMVASCGTLFWNEGRAVKRARDLEAGRNAVVSLNEPQPKSANDGSLVHTTGELKTGGPVRDAEFGVSAEAVRLRRVVEMYQWIEEEETEEVRRNGETRTKTTYRYRKRWSDRHHDSSRFHRSSGHRNPSSMPYRAKTFYAEKVELGGFSLDQKLLERIDAEQSLQLDSSITDKVPSKYAGSAKVSGSRLFLHGRTTNPKVGDVRVSYEYVPAEQASVVAGQSGNVLSPYSSEDLYDTIGLIEMGTHSADAMFETAEEENRMIKWAIRGGGFAFLLIAFMMLFKPLEVLAGAIPGIGFIVDDLVEAGTFIISLLLAVSVWTIVVAAGWLAYRPLIAIPLIMLGIAAIAGVVWLGYQAAKERRG